MFCFSPVLPSTVVTVEEDSPHACGEDFTDAFCHDHETQVPHYSSDDPWDILRRAFSCEDIDKFLQHTNTMIDARLLRIPPARERTIKKIDKSRSVPNLKEKDLMEFDELGIALRNKPLYIFKAPPVEKKPTLFECAQQKVEPNKDSEFKTQLAILLGKIRVLWLICLVAWVGRFDCVLTHFEVAWVVPFHTLCIVPFQGWGRTIVLEIGDQSFRMSHEIHDFPLHYFSSLASLPI